MSPKTNPPVGFFVMAGDRFDLDDARPVLVREHFGLDALVKVDPAMGSWLPDRPPEPVLAAVRTLLSRLVVVMTMPKGLDVMARDGIGAAVTLPGYGFRFPETWPMPVEYPFELVAIQVVDAQSMRVALRLATPKPPRSGSRPASPRRRGKPARPMDLYREKMFEMARGQRWDPKVAAAFPRAVAARRPAGEGNWPVDLAATYSGLFVQDIATGKLDTPTAKRFVQVWFVAHFHYDQVRRTIFPKVRAPLAMLSLLVIERLKSPTAAVAPGLVGLVDDLRTHAGLDLLDPAGVKALSLLLKQAASVGATTLRAATRVRREWIEVPAGFVTNEPRAAKLEPTGWAPLLDRKSFDAGQAQLLARRAEPSVAALPDTGVPIDAGIPVQLYVLDTTDGIRLAGPGFDPDALRWIMPATLHVSGWIPTPPSKPLSIG